LALSLFLFLFILIIERPGSDDANREKQQRFLIPSLKVEAVTKIELLKLNGKDYVFEKSNGAWSSRKIQEFLEKAFLLKEELVVSKNPDKQSLYAVDDAFGVRIVFYQDTKIVADFYAGKVTGLNSQYIRMSGSNDVLQATPILLDISDFPIESFKTQ